MDFKAAMNLQRTWAYRFNTRPVGVRLAREVNEEECQVRQIQQLRGRASL
jgi:hypothetical protein